MTPDQLAKCGSEHAHQVAFFAWVSVARLYGIALADTWAFQGDDVLKGLGKPSSEVTPAFKWVHAIPNGGARGDNPKSAAIVGGMLKAEGVTPGVLDIFFPYKTKKYSGLYIEMKVKKNTVTDAQYEFGEYVISQDFSVAVCYTWREARDALVAFYLY